MSCAASLGVEIARGKRQARHPPPGSQGGELDMGNHQRQALRRGSRKCFKTTLWPIRGPSPLSVRCAPRMQVQASPAPRSLSPKKLAGQGIYLWMPSTEYMVQLPLAWLRLSLSTHQDLKLVPLDSHSTTFTKFMPDIFGRLAPWADRLLQAALFAGHSKIEDGVEFPRCAEPMRLASSWPSWGNMPPRLGYF